MQIKKEVMRSGRHVYVDPDGRPAVLDATPEKIAHYHQSGVAMLAAGLPIPIPLEHDPKATPLNAADLAADRVRNNTGFVRGFERDVIKDAKTGEDVHRLLSVLDIKDAGIAAKIEASAIPFVSPWINSFRDGAGKQWDEVISHVALTTRPRIHNQQPFNSVGAALSIAAPVAKIADAGICLSRAGRLRKDGKLAFPVAFSLMSGIRLSKDEAEAIEKDEEAADKEPGADAERESPLDSVGDKPEMKDISIHETIGHLLKACGFRPPDGMSEETFERDIYETLMAKVQEMAAKPPEEPEVTDPNKPAGKAPGPVTQESPPMYMSMSLDEIKKITDPEKKQLAEAFFSLQQETSALRKNRLDDAARTRQARVERVSRLMPASARDKLVQQLASPSAQLSLGADGVVKDPMDVVLATFEEAFKGLPEMLKGNGAAFNVQPQPVDGTVTNERAEQLANSLLPQRKAVA